MRATKALWRLTCAVVLAASFSVTGVAPAPAAPVCVGVPPVPDPDIPTIDDRCEAWTAVYTNPAASPAFSADGERATAIDPGGARIYVIGSSGDDTGRSDYVTVAHSTADGHVVWTARYDAPGHGLENPSAITVSPDGARVFVTGWTTTDPSYVDYDYATVAYDAATGHQLWSALFNGPGDGTDLAWALVASPDSRTLYVTGASPEGGEGTEDMQTIAYDAATGDVRWTARYGDPRGGSEQGIVIDIAPDGSALYVAGPGRGDRSEYDIDWRIVAYGTEGPKTGELLWEHTYDGGSGLYDAPIAIVASRDGASLFATGQSYRPGSETLASNASMVTQALDARTGAVRWTKEHHGPTIGFNSGFAIAEAAGRVFVSGIQSGAQHGFDQDIGTVAYDAGTGQELWTATQALPSYTYEWAHDVGVSPDGHTVYVAGLSGRLPLHGDFVTLAYDAASGAQRWVARYNTTVAIDTSFGWNLEVAPNGSRVFTSGVTYPQGQQTATQSGLPAGNASDFVTVAYDT